MKYLIDTDIASYYLRGKYDLLNTFIRKGMDNIRISRISVAELEVLANKSPNSRINFSTIKLFSDELGILDMDNHSWSIFSMLKADMLKCGSKKGDFDILIAAVARRFSLRLVTNNTSHYNGMAETENWIEN